MLTRHRHAWVSEADWSAYQHSVVWRARCKASKVFWGVIWLGLVYLLAVESHGRLSGPVVPLAIALVCLGLGRKQGHHWRGYACRMREKPWDLLPVSRRVNWFESKIRHGLHIKAFPATLLALATLGVWPVWVYLAVRAAVG